MMFTETTALLREICNGIMFFSAACLVLLFIHYIVHRTYWRPWAFMDSAAVQAAAAIVVLMLGHSIRAFSGWMQFFYFGQGWDPTYWANAALPFITATALIFLGKLLIIFAFAPYRWRWLLIAATASVSILVPVALAFG